MSREIAIAKTVLWFMLIVALLGVGALFVIDQAEKSRHELPVLSPVPAFQFTARNGESFGLGDLQGKINVVDFVFTNCQGPCPIMSTNMAELYKFYTPSPGVQFVSISVDPARDSLEALQAYAERYGVTDYRWRFLRGPLEEVRELSEAGFFLAADQLPMGHSTKFILVDQQGRIRGYYDSADHESLDRLREHIHALASER